MNPLMRQKAAPGLVEMLAQPGGAPAPTAEDIEMLRKLQAMRGMAPTGGPLGQTPPAHALPTGGAVGQVPPPAAPQGVRALDAMRSASPTGGGLGQLSEQEVRALEERLQKMRAASTTGGRGLFGLAGGQ